MHTVIEQQYYPHCQQKNCVQLCPTGVSYYEDPVSSCVQLVTSGYDEERHFTVHAIGPQPVTLVAIDKCLISQSNPAKRCDCAFFTTEKIAFVEFKLREPNREREHDTRPHRRLEKAVEQLATTIIRFEQEGLITTETIEAYAHVGYQLPMIPAPTTMLTNLSALINAETEGYVELFATNEVNF